MQRADLIVSDVAEFTRDAHAKLSHPDFARQILVEEPEKFYKPRLIKAGVWCFCRTGADHERRRHLEAAAQADTARFHHAQLVTYGAVMVGHALHMIDSLENGAVVEIHEVMPRLTLAIVVQTLFGADVTREATDVRTATRPKFRARSANPG
jgi:hypothetical protein